MSKLPYMPLWIEPLLADTDHLTNAEFGAYVRLLCAMWRLEGAVPDDDELMKKLCHGDRRTWPALKHMLAQFVIREGGKVTQKRLREVRAQQDTKRALSVAAAEKRWHKSSKSLKSNGAADANAYADAHATDMPRALAREPKPKEPSSPKGDEGFGSPLTPQAERSPHRPVARSAREGGSRSLPPDAASLSGPFVPSEKEPPQPPKSKWLQDYEAGKLPEAREAELNAFAAKHGVTREQLDAIPDHNAKPPDDDDDDDIGHFLKF